MDKFYSSKYDFRICQFNTPPSALTTMNRCNTCFFCHHWTCSCSSLTLPSPSPKTLRNSAMTLGQPGKCVRSFDYAIMKTLASIDCTISQHFSNHCVELPPAEVEMVSALSAAFSAAIKYSSTKQLVRIEACWNKGRRKEKDWTT